MGQAVINRVRRCTVPMAQVCTSPTRAAAAMAVGLRRSDWAMSRPPEIGNGRRNYFRGELSPSSDFPQEPGPSSYNYKDHAAFSSSLIDWTDKKGGRSRGSRRGNSREGDGSLLQPRGRRARRTPGASEGRNHGVPGEGGLSFYHWAAVEGRRRDGLVEVSGMLL